VAEQKDLDIPTEGGDLGLRAEMAAGDFFLRYWRLMLGAVAAVVLGLFAFGQWRSWTTDAQRRETAAIADVEAELPGDPTGRFPTLLTIAQAKAGMRPDVTVDDAKVKDAAGKLAEVAGSASGTAAVEGWLKAAELYRIAGDAANRRKALEGAADHADGVLKYAAVAGLANLDLEEGKVDEGLGRFEALRKGDDFLARQATLDLATSLEALGRHAEAVKVYDDYLAKWPQASDLEDVRAARDQAQGRAG
jgi:hypothetical protein